MVEQGTPQDGTAIDAVLRAALKGQYHAALAMLRGAIELCPDDLWSGSGRGVPFWRIAYHALFFTHLYLQRDEASFIPWEQHWTGAEDLDEPTPQAEPYTKADLLLYWDVCDAMVGEAIDTLDVLTPETGFSWHTPQRSKVEQHVSAIRHIQHHAAQLSVRVRAASGVSVDWVGALAGGQR